MLILLVDDNPEDRALARRGLARDIPGAAFRARDRGREPATGISSRRRSRRGSRLRTGR
jgi:hypothetical protein